MIALRRSQMKEGEEKDDLLSLMLNLRDEQGNPLSEKSIRNELLVFLNAGNHTTAITFSWVMYYLATLPDVQRKVQKEVDTVLGDSVSCTLFLLCKGKGKVYPLLSRDATISFFVPLLFPDF